jgi:hypothetical protein
VIRGQVISREGNGLIGIRVSVATDPQFGFTLTRGDGWYEFLITTELKIKVKLTIFVSFLMLLLHLRLMFNGIQV